MRNIVKKFGDFTANDGINLTVHKGEIHAILGENGAGKSTTIRLLMDLIRPDSGQIRLLGRTADAALKNNIGVVLDEPGLPAYLII